MTTLLMNQITAAFRRGETSYAAIAKKCGCSANYVRKVLLGYSADWSRRNRPSVYKPITREQVVEGYFAWPTSSPQEIAQAYEADPSEVARICTALRLPFRGRIFPEDQAPRPLDASGKSKYDW